MVEKDKQEDQCTVWNEEGVNFPTLNAISEQQEDIKQLQVKGSKQQLEEAKKGDADYDFTTSFDDLPCFIEHDGESMDLVRIQQHEVEEEQCTNGFDTFEHVMHEKVDVELYEEVYTDIIEHFCSKLEDKKSDLLEEFGTHAKIQQQIHKFEQKASHEPAT